MDLATKLAEARSRAESAELLIHRVRRAGGNPDLWRHQFADALREAYVAILAARQTSANDRGTP